MARLPLVRHVMMDKCVLLTFHFSRAGEQVSIVDVHLAAWLHELVTLSGGSARDSGAAAIARLEEHVGGGFAFAKDVVIPLPGATTDGSVPAPTTTAAKAKLAVLWDALASRPSWQKVFGVEG